MESGSQGIPPVVVIIYIAVIFVTIASLWRVFTKAGKPGWAAIVPFYNLWVFVEICERPWWFFVLSLVPCVNLIISIILYIDLARVFGKGAGFAVGLVLLSPIFLPILAFGSAEYQRGLDTAAFD